ncbi:S-methyl-5'-thioadenosine phosphorylase, partial [Armatimonas sp.]|uniref:S-methyl-5'-thioadenosine phosphorylase n=1 Tax=Armatimonas sp. TaxID=1872638 RepID=UPI00286AE7EA
RWIETPYGAPSDKVVLGVLGGKEVAFLPRHGCGHTIPPHKINYRANLWAMKSLGVEAVIGPCAVGSLQKHIEPGHVVLCDQFIDRTSGRADTFYDGPIVTHVSAADPYCPILRAHALGVCQRRGVTVHENGTIVVVNGPRFSTKAESRWYTSMGWDIIGMTQYPEAYLARELELPYLNLSLVTDYDAGLVSESAEAVTHEAVLEVFAANIENLRGLLAELVETLPEVAGSPARTAMKGAQLG